MPPEEEPKRRQENSYCENMVSACTWMYGRNMPHTVCSTHFLWLSVRVIPWEETLKWTTVEVGGGSERRVIVVAFCMAWQPVRDSISTEPRYHTLQAAGTQFQIALESHLLDANNFRASVFRDTDKVKSIITAQDKMAMFGCTHFQKCHRIAHKSCVQCHLFVIMSIHSKWC